MIKKYTEKEETRLDFYRRWGKLAQPYLKWQFRQFSPYLGKRVADIGCGIGNFAEFLKNRELYLGFEPEEKLAEEFEILYKADNIKLAVNGDIASNKAAEEMKSYKVDSAICINVLEHIENDKLALSNIVKGVKTEGHICILAPAAPRLYGSLDELDRHYRRYSKKTLLKLTENQPVKIVKCYYLNFIGMFGWFIKGKVLKQKAQKNKNYKIMNMLLPVISFTENIVKPPVGMSLVLVLKKRRGISAYSTSE